MVPEEQVGSPDPVTGAGDGDGDHDEVRAQLRAYRETGDLAYRDAVIEVHLGLVRQLARRFARQGESFDDLVQAGSIGLLKAVDGFDPDLGFRFSAYAAATVIGELKRYLRDKGWAVRPPRRVQELCLELGHASAELTQKLGRSPNVSELACETDSTVDEVLEALEAGQAYRMSPLETSAVHGESATPVHLGVDDANLQTSENRIVLQQFLGTLPEQERTIIELRFFEDMTQAEIGARLGVSQMQVSRLLARILRRLKELSPEPE